MNHRDTEVTEKNVVAPNNNDVIYHYCSAESFKAIIESKYLRMSHWRSFADSSEGGKYWLNIVKEILIDEDIPEECIHFIEQQLIGIDVYGTCFGKEGDSPDHWKDFGKRGKGFALGFRINPYIGNGNGPGLSSIIYQKTAQKRLVKKSLSPWVQQLQKSLSNIDDKQKLLQDLPHSIITSDHASLIDSILDTKLLLAEIADQILLFKDQEYHQENEFRITSTKVI